MKDLCPQPNKGLYYAEVFFFSFLYYFSSIRLVILNLTDNIVKNVTVTRTNFYKTDVKNIYNVTPNKTNYSIINSKILYVIRLSLLKNQTYAVCKLVKNLWRWHYFRSFGER